MLHIKMDYRIYPLHDNIHIHGVDIDMNKIMKFEVKKGETIIVLDEELGKEGITELSFILSEAEKEKLNVIYTTFKRWKKLCDDVVNIQHNIQDIKDMLRIERDKKLN
jgi:hypothetical protein